MSYFSARFSTPQAAAGDIPTLLSSWGVSWYGGFRRGQNQFSVAADQLTPANSVGLSVGQWAPSWTGGGFSAKFVQTTNSKRPSMESVYGTSGIRGDGTVVWLQLDSTTALNRDYTVLIGGYVTVGAGPPVVYSHTNQAMRFQSPTSMGNSPGVFGSSSKKDTNATYVMANTPYDATAFQCRVGWSCDAGSTQHYNAVPNLLRSSTGANYSDALLTEVWLIDGRLTPQQMLQCLPFLVL